MAIREGMPTCIVVHQFWVTCFRIDNLMFKEVKSKNLIPMPREVT